MRIKVDYKKETVGNAASFKAALKKARLIDTDLDRGMRVVSSLWKYGDIYLRLDKDVVVPDPEGGRVVDCLSFDSGLKFYN
jgi:hypothetical protein